MIAGARILKRPVIDRFSIGIINFHPGLIPEARGLDALLWSIRGDLPLGVTSHLIDERVDASSEAARQQGLVIAERLREQGLDEVSWDQEVVALIAFLQTLGLEESAALAAERKAAAAAEAKEWAASLDPTDPETLAAGKAIYDTNCVACHGPDMLGGIGPNLVDEETIHGGSLQEIFAVTRDGVPAKGMLTWGPILGDEKVGQVSAYVFSRAQAEQASP